jgi:hypothetical protein
MKALTNAILVVAVLSATAGAQISTLSQSTNNTNLTVGSIACGSGNPIVFTFDNGYFRSYPLSGLTGNITIVSIRFGVEQVQSTSGSRPMIIRLYADPNGGAPSPFGSLVLRHTENFTLPVNTTPHFVTQAMTGAPTTFMPNETLVVEVNSPNGLTPGNTFFIGSNAAGQSAPGYLRAPGTTSGCGIADPVTLASLGYPNVHIVIDVNYVPTTQALPYPGTGEDLTLFSAIGTNALTTGVGNSVKIASAGNNVRIKIQSTGGTFNYEELILAGQLFVTGSPPFPPAAPNVYLSFAGLVVLIGGYGPLGPTLLPPDGTTVAFTVPPGLAGNSALFQAAVITTTPPLATNGFYAVTDAHQIQLQ